MLQSICPNFLATLLFHYAGHPTFVPFCLQLRFHLGRKASHVFPSEVLEVVFMFILLEKNTLSKPWSGGCLFVCVDFFLGSKYGCFIVSRRLCPFFAVMFVAGYIVRKHLRAFKNYTWTIGRLCIFNACKAFYLPTVSCFVLFSSTRSIVAFVWNNLKCEGNSKDPKKGTVDFLFNQYWSKVVVSLKARQSKTTFLEFFYFIQMVEIFFHCSERVRVFLLCSQLFLYNIRFCLKRWGVWQRIYTKRAGGFFFLKKKKTSLISYS